MESNQDRKQRILHIAKGWLALAENEEWLSESIPPFANERAPSLSTAACAYCVETTPCRDRPHGCLIFVSTKCGYASHRSVQLRRGPWALTGGSNTFQGGPSRNSEIVNRTVAGIGKRESTKTEARR
jgi:hypothetical protein